MKKILFLLTVITLVFSCKNEEKPIQNEQPIVVEEAPKQLELFITCKTDKTDKSLVIAEGRAHWPLRGTRKSCE